MRTASLIVAAGRGIRAGAATPKQYAMAGGVPVLTRTLSVFLEAPAIDLVTVVIGADDRPLYDRAIGVGHGKLTAPVIGGNTRQGSVLSGLRALAAYNPDRVLIHDGVRPFVTPGIIERVLQALAGSPGAIAAIRVADSLKRADAQDRIAETLPRRDLWRAQTPQAFRFVDILAAHEAAAAAGVTDLTDDAAVAEWAGVAVALVEGSEGNRKLTTAEDLAMVAGGGAGLADVRTGQGFDVHRFAPGDHVWLCGVRIAHMHGLEGHSDADVGLHALTDALLGAIGDGDIGEHFPNTDARWKGAASHVFLADAAGRVRRRGGTITNVDVTLLCEAPKIALHRAAMRQRMAEILQIDAGRVAVKATTTEGLGFTGRREGIAALATATVILR
ncbi:MAG: bifunctional 2-C-methyl-D-erythritol 4-phosphate cytidylyltransferase/2-C-methyl-D-erythritol 2,4-cyclodiphosphate synthase [Hyphomonadaceae bacterium]|nr:bifunctional 2-C-methyl-D-erythritol 4-phosphate cytidylyltransferase/2-C-methyl-D-erythritol 2,4-cyclodiphosphate synthase [Hyphomonadaceae bacterium]